MYASKNITIFETEYFEVPHEVFVEGDEFLGFIESLNDETLEHDET